MSTQSWTVTGMTCQHCVASVTEEVSEIAGVTEVVVDLASGALTVTSDHALPDETVRAAVEEAGYSLS
ncbi:heavy-metal-associated domain-containing protein [Nocardioides rubriscoriae]|uniref:heavy-metal-associated domain-containing protein n=1 Tax=Nocardioides rubriscoriae TaxID=642762 RepID=UPI0011E0284B|nr:heavy-metal-associated domain-containing protein [Nocardioides rubriscoriae]